LSKDEGISDLTAPLYKSRASGKTWRRQTFVGGFFVIRFPLPASLILAALFLPAAAHAGDAVKGKTVFQRCAICHRAEKDGGNGLGPNLFGVVGRKAGTAPGFAYSAAMTGSGIIWSTDKLAAYVTRPSAVVPGNRMAFSGIGNPEQVSDVVAYLASLK
jgi:cytochrome c